MLAACGEPASDYQAAGIRRPGHSVTLGPFTSKAMQMFGTTGLNIDDRRHGARSVGHGVRATYRASAAVTGRRLDQHCSGTFARLE
jgi:hypothetical protein